jgi:hypothetical protein
MILARHLEQEKYFSAKILYENFLTTRLNKVHVTGEDFPLPKQKLNGWFCYLIAKIKHN